MIKIHLDLTYPIMEALHHIIGKVVKEVKPETDDDRLLLATLHSFNLRLYNRLGKAQLQYKIMLEPTEALALRILWTDYLPETAPITPFNIWLSNASNQIQQQYS